MAPSGDAVKAKHDDLEAVVKKLGAGIDNLLSMVDRGLCGEPLETPRTKTLPQPVKPAREKKRTNHITSSQASGQHPAISIGGHHFSRSTDSHCGTVWARLHPGNSKPTATRDRGHSMRSGSPTWAGGLRGEAKKKSASPVGRHHRTAQQRSVSAEPGKTSSCVRRVGHGKRLASASVTRSTTVKAPPATILKAPEKIRTTPASAVPVVSPTLTYASPPPDSLVRSIPILPRAAHGSPHSRSTTPVRKPAPPPIVGDPSTRAQPDILTIIETQKRKADGVAAKVSTNNYIREEKEKEKEEEPQKPKMGGFKVPKLTLGGVIEKKMTDPTFTYEKFLSITTGEDDIRAAHEVVIEPKKVPSPVNGRRPSVPKVETPPPAYSTLQPQAAPVAKPKIPSLSLKSVVDKKQSDPTFTYEKFLTMTTGETDLRAEG